MNEVIRTTTIRKNQICLNCKKELLKGSKVTVKTSRTGRTIKRSYYCLKCDLKCTSCGQECFDNLYPEIVFKDKNKCICENCSVDYEEVEGKILQRQ